MTKKLTSIFMMVALGSQMIACSEGPTWEEYIYIPSIQENCPWQNQRGSEIQRKCELTVLKLQMEFANFIEKDEKTTDAQKQACKMVVEEQDTLLKKIDLYTKRCGASLDKKDSYFSALYDMYRAAHNIKYWKGINFENF